MRDQRGVTTQSWETQRNAFFEVAAGVLFADRAATGVGTTDEFVDGDNAYVLSLQLIPGAGATYTASVERSLDNGVTWLTTGVTTGSVAVGAFLDFTAPCGWYRVNVSALTSQKVVSCAFRKKLALVR